MFDATAVWTTGRPVLFPQTDLPIGNSISLTGLGKSQPL